MFSIVLCFGLRKLFFENKRHYFEINRFYIGSRSISVYIVIAKHECMSISGDLKIQR